MNGLALNYCCHVAEPYRLAYAVHENGLRLLVRLKGDDVRPLDYRDPLSKSRGETAKKCIEAGLTLEQTAKLIPPDNLMDRIKLLKEATDAGKRV